MLDDLAYIHRTDPVDALGIAQKQHEQLAHEFVEPALGFRPEHIVYAGMGGSALPALLSDTWPGYTVPFEIVRGYQVPRYVDGKTLVIASSYSGNTEETISALHDAEAKGARIAVVASGGQLETIAKDKNYPLVLLPKTDQPRYAVFYNLKGFVTLLSGAGVLAVPEAAAQLAAHADFLKTAVTAWQPDVPTSRNLAKQIAQELLGKSVVVYAGPLLFPAAYKWKISVNENAKQVAWTNQLPEFNHNEFIGWSRQPVDKPYAVIDLRSSLEHPRVQKRFEVSARLLSGMRPEPIVVTAEGQTVMEHLLWTSVLGDFVTIYLALLNGINPAPVDLVEKLKKALNE